MLAFLCFFCQIVFLDFIIEVEVSLMKSFYGASGSWIDEEIILSLVAELMKKV